MTQMDEAAKRRLVGAAVLVALAVIFVPMLVERGADDLGEPIVIPEAPDLDGVADGDSSFAESGYDPQLPDPDVVLLPLPTPEPPPSALDAESASAESRSDRQTQPGTSPAERRASESNRVTDTNDGRGETIARAAAGPKPVPPGTSAWVIQVASLGSPEAAQALQDELRNKGYPAFVEQANVSGRRYYRVRIGPEIERARADRLATQLAAETGGQPLVQRYP
ncbi:SPOR domain-containing protein [Halochromatium roseum]|uniref:SPOR domain-containing protein n=1 Tax=Halochromatium roseum TaxID=391920 RepID=UPI0019123120|nr:SPOR domain-containing protein [Halochromatium roseum]MBK5941468.1 hypothetical protein [Halochromatium roseum]